MDIFSKAKRSLVMSKIRSKNTAPEVATRKYLRANRLYYRSHNPNLPGKPDFTLNKSRTVIFIHGCFWHSHDCRKGQGAPATNSTFWERKRRLTVERDSKILQVLAANGWDSCIVWECALKNPEAVKSQLERFLSLDPACVPTAPRPFLQMAV